MNPTSRSSSRRQFLARTGAAATALLAGGLLERRITADETADFYGGFRMALQSFTLRGYDMATALGHTQQLGIKYWEASPRHLLITTVPAEVQKQRDLFSSHGITVMAYGVLKFDSDETRARKNFDFARAHSLKAIAANPAKDRATFDLLDKLVEEYQIPISIHNHGPGADYDKIADVVTVVKDRHPLVGACVDMGHYLKSDEDPLDAIEQLGPRVFGVHVKDVRTLTASNGERRKVFTIVGEGDLNLKGCLVALRKLRYDRALSLEYEENPMDPLADVQQCLAFIRETIQSLPKA